MCGIFGAIAFDRTFGPAERDEFVRVTDLVRYRGPDDSGYISLNLAQSAVEGGEAFNVFLGNRRLAILDLSPAGHQPMADEGGHWITFNGEIFNYVELRRELESRGHRFQTKTDTEVILHVYQEFGENGFNRFNGMWAFALADTRRRRLVLSRDRFSMKPLYLLRVAGCLYFASEIKQLLPLLPNRELNTSVMSQFLVQGLLDHSPETFFERIQRVPPETNIVIQLDTGEMQEKKYWSFTNAVPDRRYKEAEVFAEFRELFNDSIRLRLRGDVKTGVLLSGGLDSSAIAIACNRIAEGGVQTYSVLPDEKACSEQRFVDAMTATGIANQKISFHPSHVLADLSDSIYHSDEPFGGFSVVAQSRLLRRVKEAVDVTVLLSGQGGDEVLLGYLKFFFFHLRLLVRRRRYRRATTEAISSFVRGTVIRQFTLREARRYVVWGANNGSRILQHKPELVPIWECDDLRSRQISDIHKYSVPALTHYEDRNASAHSLEVRHPFLDHRLVEFLVNLPVELKIRNGWTKYVLRQSLPELPPAVRWRKDKRPFITPEEQWLKAELKPFVRDTFANSKLEQLEVLDSREFLRYYDQFCHGRAIASNSIARILIAEIWARQFFN